MHSGRLLRQNRLSNRVFGSCDNIVDHCCYAWNQLTDQPWTILSIGMPNRARWVNLNESPYHALDGPIH